MTAREGARIGLNEVPLGLKFPPYTFAMVRARLHAPLFQRVILEGGLYLAREALDLGLIDAIGEEEDAKKRFTTLASHPRDAYTAAKCAVRGRLLPTEAELRTFREDTIPYWAAPARKEKMRAALAKRS
jgi:enoyl-CoA hydratase/carnithine racemase